ncbi:MAG: T9SS type A sorting domain-containing protein, partial [Saprospiraceae bacterium]
DDTAASTTFDSNDWMFSGANALDGESTNAGATTPYPSPDQDCPAPLPVELISFRVIERGTSASLTWQTASEENNSHFEVEHSTNGRNFQTLDKVIGNGTTSEIQEYNYSHDNAAVGINYYRLRQVDFDGGFEYSDVVSIEVEGDSKVNLYPTVADQQITVSFGETTREDKEVLIYNIAGLQVSAAQIPAGTDRFEVPVANLQTGIYFVHMMVNGELATFKFVR